MSTTSPTRLQPGRQNVEASLHRDEPSSMASAMSAGVPMTVGGHCAGNAEIELANGKIVTPRDIEKIPRATMHAAVRRLRHGHRGG